MQMFIRYNRMRFQPLWNSHHKVSNLRLSYFYFSQLCSGKMKRTWWGFIGIWVLCTHHHNAQIWKYANLTRKILHEDLGRLTLWGDERTCKLITGVRQSWESPFHGDSEGAGVLWYSEEEWWQFRRVHGHRRFLGRVCGQAGAAGQVLRRECHWRYILYLAICQFLKPPRQRQLSQDSCQGIWSGGVYNQNDQDFLCQGCCELNLWVSFWVM